MFWIASTGCYIAYLQGQNLAAVETSSTAQCQPATLQRAAAAVKPAACQVGTLAALGGPLRNSAAPEASSAYSPQQNA